MARLIVFGAGDIARLAHFYFSRDSEHEVAAFCVDAAHLERPRLLGLPVVPFEEVTRRFPAGDYRMFVALSYAGMNRLRARKYAEAKALGYELVSYVSSRATVLSDHPVGDNCFILEDNTIQPFVEIGNDVTLWSGNHIGHDSTLGDHCFVTSHVVVSGNCRIGEYSFLGVNSTLRNSITLAPATLVGAGAVIMGDTVEGGVYPGPRTAVSSRRSDEVEL